VPAASRASATTAPCGRQQRERQHGRRDTRHRGDRRGQQHAHDEVGERVDVRAEAGEEVTAAEPGDGRGVGGGQAPVDAPAQVDHTAQRDVVGHQALEVAEHPAPDAEGARADHGHRQRQHRRLLSGPGDQPRRGRCERHGAVQRRRPGGHRPGQPPPGQPQGAHRGVGAQTRQTGHDAPCTTRAGAAGTAERTSTTSATASSSGRWATTRTAHPALRELADGAQHDGLGRGVEVGGRLVRGVEVGAGPPAEQHASQGQALALPGREPRATLPDRSVPAALGDHGVQADAGGGAGERLGGSVRGGQAGVVGQRPGHHERALRHPRDPLPRDRPHVAHRARSRVSTRSTAGTRWRRAQGPTVHGGRDERPLRPAAGRGGVAADVPQTQQERP